METTHAPQRISVSASRSPLFGANSIFSDEHVTKMCGDDDVRELQVREPQHYTLEELHATTETNEEIAQSADRHKSDRAGHQIKAGQQSKSED